VKFVSDKRDKKPVDEVRDYKSIDEAEGFPE